MQSWRLFSLYSVPSLVLPAEIVQHFTQLSSVLGTDVAKAGLDQTQLALQDAILKSSRALLHLKLVALRHFSSMMKHKHVWQGRNFVPVS